MVLDYHLHLWEHGPRPLEATLEQVAAYCDRAAAQGVDDGWWDDTDDQPAVRAAMAAYWEEEQGADLDQYVEVALAAKAEGLPVALGLEVDHYPGRMDDVARILAGYPFDVLLGSVHWIGAWGFDNLDDPTFAGEWDRRDVESIWSAYTDALAELAATGTCDVLAHPDLVKVGGRFPSAAAVDECHARMAEAAASSGMAAEVSSAGWFKPVGEAYPAPSLLGRFREAGVPITTASDAHRLDRVATHRSELRELVRGAGYDTLRAFEGRRPREVAL